MSMERPMRCPACQHDNRPTAKFCTKCRTRLDRSCPSCGAAYDPDDAFCAECGADLLAALSPVAHETTTATLEQQFATLRQSIPDSLHRQLLSESEGENRIA